MLNKRYGELHRIFILFAFLVVVAGVLAFGYTNDYYEYANIEAEYYSYYGEAPELFGYNYYGEAPEFYGYEEYICNLDNTTYEQYEYAQFGPGEPSPWPSVPLAL